MTCIVEWAGREYDVDPEEFTTAEVGECKKRANLDFPQLVVGVARGNGDALRALFWVIDRRGDPGLRFDSYTGPPMKVWRQLMPFFVVLAEDMGKEGEAALASANGSSDGSPSSTHGAAPSSSID